MAHLHLNIQPGDSTEEVCAKMIRHFSTDTGEAPADPVLAAGHRAAHAWRALMSTVDPDPEKVDALMRYVAPHRAHSGMAWQLLYLAVCSWRLTLRTPATVAAHADEVCA